VRRAGSAGVAELNWYTASTGPDVLVLGGVDRTPERHEVGRCARAVFPDRAQHDRAKARIARALHRPGRGRGVLGGVLDSSDQQRRFVRDRLVRAHLVLRRTVLCRPARRRSTATGEHEER